MTSRILACLFFVLSTLAGTTPASAAHSDESEGVGEEALNRLPLDFTPNLGQWNFGAQFVARRAGATIFLESDSIKLSLTGTDGNRAAVFLNFAGASDAVRLDPRDRLSGVKNYFFTPERTRTKVPIYARVRYEDLYDGIDLEVYEGGSLIEYDLIVSPGTDLGAVIVECEGVDSLEVAEDGSLLMATAAGPIRQSAPRTWVNGEGGERIPVRCEFRLLGDDRYGFEVESYDRSRELVVDPEVFFNSLQWSTYLGGQGGGGESGDDKAWDVAVAKSGSASGEVTVVGGTLSIDFPTTAGLTTNLQGLDVFVTRLNSSASAFVYSTYFGGSCNEQALAVDLAWDPQDETQNPTWAAVTGTIINGSGCTSPVPTAGAFDPCSNKFTAGSTDAFVLLLDQAGGVNYFSFLGGEGNEEGHDIAVLPTTSVGQDIEVYVCGWMTAPPPGVTGPCVGSSYVNFPTTPLPGFPGTPTGFQTAYQGGAADAFFSKLRLAGAGGADLLYSSHLGSPGEEKAFGLAVDPNDGHCVVTGFTTNNAFPKSAGAFQLLLQGQVDAFVSRFNPFVSGVASLPNSTLLGGGVDGIEEAGYGVVLQGTYMSGQNVTVIGTTYSATFPTLSAFDATYNGAGDAFVTRLDGALSSLVWSTYLGGSGEDGGRDICIVPTIVPGGRVSVCGLTGSTDFPVLPMSGPNKAYDTTHNGSLDAFVSQFGMAGGLANSTFIGGEFADFACGMSPDGERDVVVCGVTGSTEADSPPFPITPGVVQPTFGGGGIDGFVLKLRVNRKAMGQ